MNGEWLRSAFSRTPRVERFGLWSDNWNKVAFKSVNAINVIVWIVLYQNQFAVSIENDAPIIISTLLLRTRSNDRRRNKGVGLVA